MKENLDKKIKQLRESKIELAHQQAQSDLLEVLKMDTEIDLLKFIAIKLININQKLDSL